MTAADLARLAIRVLDKQQEYFRTRNGTTLRESKDLERRLREACTAVLNPPKADLFTPTEESQ